MRISAVVCLPMLAPLLRHQTEHVKYEDEPRCVVDPFLPMSEPRFERALLDASVVDRRPGGVEDYAIRVHVLRHRC